jgi:hypothetical protein
VDGEHASLRRLVTDMVGEYGRHAGHADLPREAVDGLAGEDPPDRWRPESGRYRLPGGTARRGVRGARLVSCDRLTIAPRNCLLRARKGS